MIVIACHIPFIFFSGKEGVCIIIDELDRKSISSALFHKLQNNTQFARETEGELPPNPDLPCPGEEDGMAFNEVPGPNPAESARVTEQRTTGFARSKFLTEHMTMVQANRLAYKDMKPLYYYSATLAFYGIQIFMAYLLTDISTIFDFASAIAISSLAFLFPGTFYKLAWKKYGEGQERDNFC